jgi:superfamily I DNA and RNA helicase
MSNSFFYMQIDKNDINKNIIESLEKWATDSKTQTYVIDKPLGDTKYSYKKDSAFVILIPKCKITFVNFNDNSEQFQTYIDDFIEDLGSISDKYRYKDWIGRPRTWSKDLVAEVPNGNDVDINSLLQFTAIDDPAKQRIGELLISLLTGSINDIAQVRADLPENLLDKIKRKILLFDGDQTRFVYQKNNQPTIRIQGLSGTGKTELLLHKLKELYIANQETRIAITCHNKILANSLKSRIPEFFNFMKVEQQIIWDERLLCTHAWGSQNDKYSGIYSFICHFYGIQFERWSAWSPFNKVCTNAIKEIRAKGIKKHAFDYVLIDESQDFPESFFELCQIVTKNVVYIAGDVFQSIFDENITADISPDFLLSKCYRTDPKTLMFAHSLGMGLFEEQKLRWLEDEEWLACGYLVEKFDDGSTYHLKREPLRRFEDINKENIDCVEIHSIEDDFSLSASDSIINIIQQISKDNPTVTPDDISIILLDNDNASYALADKLEQLIPRKIGWEVNKAYESKHKIPETLFISNVNNVKGLEFPFVICVTEVIKKSYRYRNALYMTLTRSFLKSYILLSKKFNKDILADITTGLTSINKLGYIEAKSPSEEEKEAIKTTIRQLNRNISFYDFIQEIFDELKIRKEYRTKLMEVVKQTIGEDFDRENVKEVIRFNYERMSRSKR